MRLLSALPLLQLGCAARIQPARGAHPRPASASPSAPELAELEVAYEALMSEHSLHEWARYAGQEPPGHDPAAAMQSLRRREQERDDCEMNGGIWNNTTCSCRYITCKYCDDPIYTY